MIKEDFIARLAEAAGIQHKEANAYLTAVIHTLTNTLGQGDSIRFNGLGTFSVKTRSARTGRNPRTGETLQIPEAKVVNFSPAKELKDKVNSALNR